METTLLCDGRGENGGKSGETIVADLCEVVRDLAESCGEPEVPTERELKE
jgi:hypothetical protein